MRHHTLQKQFLQTGAILAAIAVGLGAFAAHQLKGSLAPDEMHSFDTGVRYQFYHSLGILLLSASVRRLRLHIAMRVYLLFVIGIILFSGSLYLLSTRSLWAPDGIKVLGIVTPLGGISFIAGWLMLAYNGFRPAEGISREHHPGKKSKIPNSDN